MHKENWDDLRFVLAVARHGSVSAAARVLGVNHATVLRRIAAFEDRHGSTLFDKTPQGYSIPKERDQVIEAAQDVENAVLAVERLIEGVHAPLKGRVRVTSTDTFCATLLPDCLMDLRKTASDLQIEVITSNAHLDLARLDADVTIRPTLKLPPELRGQVVADLAFGIYATVDAPDFDFVAALAEGVDLVGDGVAVDPVDRTAKFYVGGKQARPDGGYSKGVWSKRGKLLGHVGLANRKDVRNAVEAMNAAKGWGKTTGHLRAQILYYMGENLSARADEFAARLDAMTGKRTGAGEVEAAIDRLFTWAAWADKHDGRAKGVPLRGIALAMNEPVGKIGAFASDDAPLLGGQDAALADVAGSETHRAGAAGVPRRCG